MLANPGQSLQPQPIGQQQMIERAMQAAKENSRRAAVLLLGQVQCGGIDASIGPVIVIRELSEVLDAHRLCPQLAEVSISAGWSYPAPRATAML
jgi:hypothetical protein